MSDVREFEQPLVFGLDIGTRNVVGTVGYRIDNEFIVVAQSSMEHETRAMLDGQIHDIGRVGRIIGKVKEQLEAQTGQPLTEVCIAAAGRVLKTVTTNVSCEFPEEMVVTGEDIHTLDLLGVERAQEILKEQNDTNYKFYCVGYSVVKYYLNDEPFSSLESHKADRIAEDIIVTFLPEDVVDGLYAAVGMAGLSVANMTLEPIAAINVAIPENFRLLNIALVDIGAGTSDISVTRDGSIIAYGMIPLAGDEITEMLVQHYLVDFKTAEHIKMCSGKAQEVTYKDIMMIEHTIPAEEVWELTFPLVDRMTTEVANKIRELNGDKTVSATFVVGGGGKIHGYTEMLAEKLELPRERVALRGEEVLQEVTFEQADIKKDPLLVTPIGICLNYYVQRNSFIMVRFNGERVKMYDNNRLTVVDAAMQAGFPNEDLFPKRGKELQFTVNGVTRIVRGVPGESATIYMNDRPASINTPLEPNSDIVIMPSTQGAAAYCTLEQLAEASSASMVFIVNGRIVRCPNYLEVNGSLELPSYLIQEGDAVETRSFYTIGQLAAFMDVEIDMDREILVNNRVATMDTLIYENFTVDWTVLSYGVAAINPEELEMAGSYYSNLHGIFPGVQPEGGHAAPAGSMQLLFGGKTFRGTGMAGAMQNTGAVADTAAGVQPRREAGDIQPGLAGADVSGAIGAGQVFTVPGYHDGVAGQMYGYTTGAVEMVPEAGPLPVREEPEYAKMAEAVREYEAAQAQTYSGYGAEAENLAAGYHEKAVEGAFSHGSSANGYGSVSGWESTVPESGYGAMAEETLPVEVPVESAPGAGSGEEVSQAGPVPEDAERETASGTETGNQGAAGTAESVYAQESSDSMEAVKTAGPVETTEPAATAESADSANDVREEGSAESADTAEPADSVSDVKETGSAESADSVSDVKEEGFAEPANTAEPVDSVNNVKAGGFAEPADSRGTGEEAPESGGSAEASGTDGDLVVYVNETPVSLTGKKQYIFVDVFDFYDFDLTVSRGRAIITNLNGERAQFSTALKDGDKIELKWKED